MSRLFKLLPLALVLCAPLAHADELDGSPAPDAATADVDNIYVGVGLFRDMLNFNLETVTSMGNFMLRVGQFQASDSYTANVSWRRPLEGGGGYLSGFYLGFFGGFVAADKLAGEEHNRLGAGAEMGYHWVKEYTRTEVTVGLGAAEPVEEGDKELSAEPAIFFSVNVALGY